MRAITRVGRHSGPKNSSPTMNLPTPYEQRLAEILGRLGISESYGMERKMMWFAEAAELVPAGLDIYGREQRLAPRAATAWRAMQTAAAGDGVALQLVSAFRSVDYQRQIIERKLAVGEQLKDILRVNAAPGYSEHHTGRAVDLTAPGCLPLTEEFERTAAFAWLAARAAQFCFVMTYPRGNPHGIVYEPWHWALAET